LINWLFGGDRINYVKSSTTASKKRQKRKGLLFEENSTWRAPSLGQSPRRAGTGTAGREMSNYCLDTEREVGEPINLSVPREIKTQTWV